MDFNSNDLVLAGVVLIVIILIRTLILASKEINSSNKFPSSSNYEEDKKDNEGSPWDENWIDAFRNCGFSIFVDCLPGISPKNLSFHFF